MEAFSCRNPPVKYERRRIAHPQPSSIHSMSLPRSWPLFPCPGHGRAPSLLFHHGSAALNSAFAPTPSCTSANDDLSWVHVRVIRLSSNFCGVKHHHVFPNLLQAHHLHIALLVAGWKRKHILPTTEHTYLRGANKPQIDKH